VCGQANIVSGVKINSTVTKTAIVKDGKPSSIERSNINFQAMGFRPIRKRQGAIRMAKVKHRRKLSQRTSIHKVPRTGANNNLGVAAHYAAVGNAVLFKQLYITKSATE
jgi:hypothetical protein